VLVTRGRYQFTIASIAKIGNSKLKGCMPVIISAIFDNTGNCGNRDTGIPEISL
jgi:hypothetical protein